MSLAVSPLAPPDETVSARGYASSAYAEALSFAGRPRRLPTAGASLLERPLPSALSFRRDALAPYPLLSCARWEHLAGDLEALSGDASTDRLVSVVAVTDPFAEATPDDLQRAFPDCCARYKDHYIADLKRPLANFVSSHHQRYARSAGRAMSVEFLQDPASHLDAWHELYDVLITRHGITGLTRFSRASFAAQLALPDMRAFAARMRSGALAAMVLFIVRAPFAYYHLAAYSELGYRERASFPLFWHALEQLPQDGVRWVSLGAGAALDGQGTAGLVRWKQGWATETRPTFLGGRIVDRVAYDHLKAARAALGPLRPNFFPAYRSGDPL